MKNLTTRVALAALVGAVVTGTASVGSAALVNWATSASGFGLLPNESTAFPNGQGTAAGIADGRMFEWGPNSPVVTSPRRVAPDTDIQPYMTWSSPVDVRVLRIWNDAAPAWDRIVVDTLVGPAAGATVESNWVTRYDSGTGLTGTAAVFQEINIPSVVSHGVRVRAFTSGDADVGEVNVFSGYDFVLSQRRVMPIAGPTGVTASSSEHRGPDNARDVNWYTNWLSADPSANPGSDFTFDLNFTRASINGASLTWGNQNGFATNIPTTWELLYSSGGGPLISLGTFLRETAQNGVHRGQYYYDFGTTLMSVTQLRVRIPESALGGTRASIVEFEAFFVPEPASLGVLGGLILLASRRRRQ